MLRNQASDLIKYGRIKTTVARGKELRPFVERLITLAKRSLGDEPSSASFTATGRTTGARLPLSGTRSPQHRQQRPAGNSPESGSR